MLKMSHISKIKLAKEKEKEKIQEHQINNDAGIKCIALPCE